MFGVFSFREGSIWSILVAWDWMVPVCYFGFLAECVSSYKVRKLISCQLGVLKNWFCANFVVSFDLIILYFAKCFHILNFSNHSCEKGKARVILEENRNVQSLSDTSKITQPGGCARDETWTLWRTCPSTGLPRWVDDQGPWVPSCAPSPARWQLLTCWVVHVGPEDSTVWPGFPSSSHLPCG